MSNFKLDSELTNNAVVIGELPCCQVLLMKNKVVPWFVLVPKVAGVSEIFELDKVTQQQLMEDINVMSRFVKNNFTIDKLNVAAIGNIVKQLHLHVVGRSKNDCAWPGVVWGMKQHEAYTEEEITEIKQKFQSSTR